jgi:hypothetical protein
MPPVCPPPVPVTGPAVGGWLALALERLPRGIGICIDPHCRGIGMVGREGSATLSGTSRRSPAGIAIDDDGGGTEAADRSPCAETEPARQAETDSPAAAVHTTVERLRMNRLREPSDPSTILVVDGSLRIDWHDRQSHGNA